MDGETRRNRLLDRLRAADEPLNGSALADTLGVSRQVIVQDVAVLRAGGAPILSTARGYTLSVAPEPTTRHTVYPVRHTRAQTEDELNLLVDLGITVRDVIVRHPIYGELRGNLMVSCREDVRAFMAMLEERGTKLLSELTDGYHYHTVEARDPQRLERGKAALRQQGYWVEEMAREALTMEGKR